MGTELDPCTRDVVKVSPPSALIAAVAVNGCTSRAARIARPVGSPVEAGNGKLPHDPNDRSSVRKRYGESADDVTGIVHI